MATKNISALKILGFEGRVFDMGEPISDSTDSIIKHYLKEVEHFGVDYAYFSGTFPTVYFKQVERFDDNTLKEISAVQKKIWNQGKAAFLYVESDVEIRVFNCVEKPVYVDVVFKEFNQKIQLAGYSKNVEKNLEELKEVFDIVSIDSGAFWDSDYAKKLDFTKKINRALIENLKLTRTKIKEDLKEDFDLEIIHNLLLRSLFILFLEDRGATEKSFYQAFLPDAKSYFDILKDKTATYKLFDDLEKRFNGNLSPVSQEERNAISETHLIHIKNCFWSDLSVKYQQEELLFDWKIFDFSIIPIELISEIYEEFLESVDEEQKDDDGAYYTPNILVDFILNKVLPYPNLKDEASSTYNLKILDPTCGSGIFLVQSLNRLLDRWTFSNPGKKLNFDIIANIVKTSIFGIDINPEAVKVAAFSLYLAMINRLDPKELWKEVQFPYLIYNPKATNATQQGTNLFIMSSLGEGSFNEIEFDLVVGNPPFGRGGLDKEIADYLSKAKFPQEKVTAFIHKAIEFSPKGTIALVSAAKVLFNNSSTYQDFRKFLFQDCYVEEVHNFSIFRKIPKKHGQRLFSSAVAPSCVFIYRNEKPKIPSNTILYSAPKTYIKKNMVDGLVIDITDIKYLPREECQKPDTKIWKVAMWGTKRDFDFLQTLQNLSTLENLLKASEFEKGDGFQLSNPKNKENNDIKNIPFIKAKKIDRYYTNKASSETITDVLFRRFGNIKTYKAPHILIKKGQSNREFTASFLDYDCSFMSTIYGIYSSDADKLKILTTLLNSSFSAYYLFLTSASWGIEREEVKPNEVYSIPNILDKIDENSQNQIIKSFDKLIALKKSNIVYSNTDVKQIEEEIDSILMKSLGFSEKEQFLINDIIDYTLDAFNETTKEKSIAYEKPSDKQKEAYCNLLVSSINNFLGEESELNVWSTHYTVKKAPLALVSIHFNTEQKKGAVIEENTNIHKILKKIDEYTYEKFSESIYFRKVIKYYKDNVIYILKPNEQRFWTGSMAMNDADEIIAEILNS